jgi:outer membrane protein assembly factor BamA
MLSGTNTFYTHFCKALIAGTLLLAFASCTIVKKYQPNKPFVYKTNINLIGNFSNEEKEQLIAGLKGQLDDSMQVRKVDKLLWSTMKNPAVYDSANAESSILFMRALLTSLGYFNDSISYNHLTKQEGKDELRTTVNFFVNPGKQVKLDSISYNLRKTPLQVITDSVKKNAYIKRGDAFAKAPISAELDRLTEEYRNNGYLKFTRDELVGIWDTLDVALLQPSMDPFEQLELLQKLRLRRENPTANLEIRLKNADSTRLTKYYIGNVTLYPDYTPDTAGLTRKDKIVKGIKVVQHNNRFRPQIFPTNIYLPKDSVYSQRRYLRTINRFNSLGTWRVVNIDQLPRKDQDTVDFLIRLTPAKKYAFNTTLEGSINQSAVSGTLFGIGVNVGLQNKNFARSANTTTSNIRYGIELGSRASNRFIQTQQVSFSHNIYFPRAIPSTRLIPDRFKDNFGTTFSFNTAYTQRFLLYKLFTINGAWGYQFQRNNQFKRRSLLLSVKIPNIEYSRLNPEDSLTRLIDSIPSLRNIFTDGFISSVITNLTLTGGPVNRPNLLKINVEESGLLTGMIRNKFLDSQLYRFIKLDVEYAKLFRYKKSSLALRVFGGIGYELGSTRNPKKRNTMPFFKQYFGGGPNSMRAWSLRRLGQGSAIKQFSGQGSFPDRYGDVQLEANVEYRFPIGTPFGIKINGAFFTDIGNVWFLKSVAGPSEEVFNFKRLAKDIAIGAGGGLRVDFDFFVIRFDYSYKIKDPSPEPVNAALQNKWFGYRFFAGDQFQLGIGYPFIF